VTVCGCLCSNAFVDDCVEFFYSKRLLGLQRDNLKPVRKEAFRPRNDYSSAATTVPKTSVPTDFGKASPRGISYSRRPYQPRNAWQQSGMRRADHGTSMSESAVDPVDRQQADDVEPQSRRARFRPRNTEPDDKLDIDRVMTFLDQMNFKPSKNKAASKCTAATNADSFGSPATSDVSMLTPTAAATRTVAAEIPVCDDTALTSSQSTDEAIHTAVRDSDVVRTPPGAAGIPDNVIARNSLSGEKSSDSDTSTSPEPLYSSPPETAEREFSSHRINSRRRLCVTDSGRRDSYNPLSESAAENLPTSAVTLSPPECCTTSNDTQLDQVTNDDGDGNSELEGVVFSPQRPTVSHVSPAARFSPAGVHTPRILSADASYYLEQEDGDVIVESSSEEDFDDWQ